jgi:hypothetical protein
MAGRIQKAGLRIHFAYRKIKIFGYCTKTFYKYIFLLSKIITSLKVELIRSQILLSYH